MRKFRKILMYIIVIGIICGTVFYFIYKNGSRNAIAGIREPVQTETSGSTDISVNGYNLNLKYLYEYDIEALVVSTHDYRGNNVGAALAPKDLALAWGLVAERNKDVDFHWKQNNRWYYWRVNTYEEIGMAGGQMNIISQSSNNHIIPANDDIKEKVKRIRRGDHIRLQGFLVNVVGGKSDGSTFHWYTSTKRTDTGDGSCEVLYVTGVEWL